MAELQNGVVKWFNDAKGFGFIEHESGKDVFVHYSVIEQDGFKTLKDGEEVSYELKEGDKGLHALRVFRTNSSTSEVSEVSEVKTEAMGELTAPNLQSGSVPTAIRTAASMIEIEKEGKVQDAEATDDPLLDETISDVAHINM